MNFFKVLGVVLLCITWLAAFLAVVLPTATLASGRLSGGSKV
jgi:hypothetical protein